MVDENNQNEKRTRRGLTSVTLGWIADRFRKAQAVKEKLDNKEYSVNSQKLAESILNKQ